MGAGEDGGRTYSLRRAAGIVVGLVAVLPLLLFAYTLYTLGALGKPRAQLTLTLALGAALIGLYLFRGMTNRMADILRAAAQGAEPPAGSSGEPQGGFHLPGLGVIRETEAIRETVMLPGAVEQLRTVWQAEAEPLLGQRVMVSVRNSPEPIVGTLTQVTSDGLLLLDEAGRRVGISYRRVSAVEAERAPAR